MVEDLVKLPPTAYVVKVIDKKTLNIAWDNFQSNSSFKSILDNKLEGIKEVRSDPKHIFLIKSQPELFDDEYRLLLISNNNEISGIQDGLRTEINTYLPIRVLSLKNEVLQLVSSVSQSYSNLILEDNEQVRVNEVFDRIDLLEKESNQIMQLLGPEVHHISEMSLLLESPNLGMVGMAIAHNISKNSLNQAMKDLSLQCNEIKNSARSDQIEQLSSPNSPIRVALMDMDEIYQVLSTILLHAGEWNTIDPQMRKIAFEMMLGYPVPDFTHITDMLWFKAIMYTLSIGLIIVTGILISLQIT